MDNTPSTSEFNDLVKRVEGLERGARRRFYVLLLALFALLILLAGSAGWGIWRLKDVEKTQTNLAFSDTVNDYTRDADFISIQIGTIQFLRRGYSITFDSARYSQDGLTLVGTVGNPTQLWISSLTLNFSVRPYAYQVREKWNRDKFIFWNTSDFEVGKAQVNVGTLNPGSTTVFSVTIPNVKQTKDEPQVAVWFSGERYNYLK
jgi:hypothetical protein